MPRYANTSTAAGAAKVHSRRRNTVSAFAAVLFLLAPVAGLEPKETRWTYTSKEFLDPIKYLASDKLQGRGDGAPGLEMAARYIERRFKKYGLQPAGDDGSYLQHFTITAGAKLGPNNSLACEVGGSSRTLKLSEDFIPLSFSESLELHAPLVFAGYGISAPEFHYDDYRGIDAIKAWKKETEAKVSVRYGTSRCFCE